MNKFLKISVIAVIAQAVFAGAAAAEEARPVAVNITVGELSDATSAISAAVASGDNYKAGELLSDLYSGGLKAEKAAPVYTDKCCPYAHAAAPAAAAPAAAAPAAVAPAAGETPVSAMTAEQRAEAQLQSIYATDAARAEKEKKDKEQKAKDEAVSQKKFNWGVAILTVALIILFL